MKKQKGYIQIVLVVFALLIGVMMFPLKFPTQQVVETTPEPTHYCRDLIDSPNAPTVTAPSYTGNEVLRNSPRTYRMIKQNVAIDKSLTLDVTTDHHFMHDFKEPYTDSSGKHFLIRIPEGAQGRSYSVPSETGGENYIQFADYGILYLFHANDAFDITVSEKVPRPGGGEPMDIVLADIYKAVETPALPDWVLTCYDAGTGGNTDVVIGGQEGGIYKPTQDVSPDRDEMQLEWFLFTKNKVLLQAWWVPHCKPAVYLYPKNKQLVNVRIKPLGELGYTDPVYPQGSGWTVTAYPDGALRIPNAQYPMSNDQYDYLYYESKLFDSEIRKPGYGWVVKGLRDKNQELRDIEELFDEILPKLGLNEKEASDFKEYWLKTLPESPYYFVGLVDKGERDRLEELLVTPKPDTSIRFSLYFEPLENPVSVFEPVINTPKREGFTLVDWGGMIKLHKDTPFTCSQ